MAEAAIISDHRAFANHYMNGRSLVCAGPLTAYLFFETAANAMAYIKTTDGGATWGDPVTIGEGADNTKWCVWFDRWTSEVAGDLIHCWYSEYVDGTNDLLRYRNIDTADGDALSTPVTVDTITSMSSAVDWNDSQLTGVRARGGNLVVCGYLASSNGYAHSKSTDGGATWGDIATTWGAVTSKGLLVPGNEDDANDVWLIYANNVVLNDDILELRVYDNSGNSWATTVIDNTAGNDYESQADDFFKFDVVHRHSDNHAVIAIWNDHDNVAADLKVYDIGATDSITPLPDVVTNSTESAGIALFIAQNTGTLYAAYFVGGTWTSTVDLVIRTYSGGPSWTSAVQVSTTTDDLRSVCLGTSAGLAGGLVLPIWYNDDLTDIITDAVNAIAVPAMEVGGAVSRQRTRSRVRGNLFFESNL